MNKAAQILVVDDQIQNIQLLNGVLKEAGYQVMGAKSGPQALQIIPKTMPDLILLDISMPEMDGFEVCRVLKSQSEHRHIPIIFLTAKTDANDILTAFESGGVDYITKPFQNQELLARVNTHLTLQEKNRQLEHLNREKNRFLATASHDLKNPLANLLMLVQIIKEHDFAHVDELKPYLPIIERSSLRMMDIINQLLDVNRIESGKGFERDNMHIQEAIEQVLQGFATTAHQKEMTLDWQPLSQPAWIHSNAQLFSQIFDNLVSNALKYSPLGSQITVSMKETSEQFLISVQDKGPGFTEKDQEQMFNQFARLSAAPTGNETSTGLGLSIVKQLTTILDASISVDTHPGQGSCFTVGFNKEPSKT